jgi:hypothetical protein
VISGDEPTVWGRNEPLVTFALNLC